MYVQLLKARSRRLATRARPTASEGMNFTSPVLHNETRTPTVTCASKIGNCVARVCRSSSEVACPVLRMILFMLMNGSLKGVSVHR